MIQGIRMPVWQNPCIVDSLFLCSNSVNKDRRNLKMKKIMSLLVILALAVSCMFPTAVADEKKINVVTTIFPIYDWSREVAGENDNVQLTLLLDSGVDLHSYQPTAADIMKIATCDVFIYVGGESDDWVEDALQEAVNPNMIVINLVEAMGEDIKMEEIVEGMEHEHEDHDEDVEDHDHDDDRDDSDEHDNHDEDHDHNHDHEDEADEHVWLSLRNAHKLVNAIASAFSSADSAHAENYQANAAAYSEKLAALDQEYCQAVSEAAFKTVLFGDRFPFRYLVDDYKLSYYAAFSGCSAETEASFQTIVFLAQKVDELKLPAVLTIEGTNHKIAETIINTTTAKNQKLLTMNSMQGCTAEDVKDGTTYLSVMESNLAILQDALN